MGDLLDIAVRACEVAMGAGAEFAQVSASRGRSFSVSLEKGAIETSQQREHSGVSVRAWYRGGVGSTGVNVLDWDRIEEAARGAAALAKQSDPDPDFVSLPGPEPLPEVEGLHDERMAGLSVAQVVRWALEGTDEALAAVPEAIVSGGAGFGVGDSAMANSVGVQVMTPYSGLSCYIRAVVRRGDSVGTWFEHTYGRVMEDFKPEGIGKVAAEGAVEYLDARDIPSGDYALVLGPQAADSVYYSIASQANAEDMQRKRSYLIGKRGQRIAPEVLTIVDDALIPRGRSSSRCDADGVPRRPLTIVQDGVLVSHLHNHYTANKAGEPNTGHSAGDGIGPTNVNVALGTRSSRDLIAEVDDGLYVTAGGPSADGTTGDFSTTLDFGFKIEKGEIVYPIRNAALGGSFLEFLQGLDAVSSDYREEPGSLMPTIRVTSMRIAGSA
jgi:PmbA protein